MKDGKEIEDGIFDFIEGVSGSSKRLIIKLTIDDSVDTDILRSPNYETMRIWFYSIFLIRSSHFFWLCIYFMHLNSARVRNT